MALAQSTELKVTLCKQKGRKEKKGERTAEVLTQKRRPLRHSHL